LRPLLLVALVAAVALPAAATARHSQSDELTKVTLITEWVPWAGHAGIWAAVEAGYYRDAGLDVKIISPPKPGDQTKFVAQDRAQIGINSSLDIVFGQAEGAPIKAFAPVLNGNPTGILSPPEKGIRGPKDLVGKTLALAVTPDATGPFQTIMQRVGVDPSKVRTINPGYASMQLLFTKKVDAVYAVVGGETAVYRVHEGKDGSFFRFTNYGVPNFWFLNFFTSNSYLASHPDVLKRFVQATEKGTQALKNPSIRKRALSRIQSANDIFKPAEHAAGVDQLMPYFPARLRFDPAVWRKTVAWMVDHDLLPASKVKAATTYYQNVG
jgi:putative hydroxymethylpyrimidine transport system substrate-binding protein